VQEVDALQWQSRPSLDRPVMLAAFEGWTDAGGAASSAASYLAEQWHAELFATIDAEEFYDFTSQRPQVRLDTDNRREIVWPQNRFFAAHSEDGSDVVLLIGVEPHLRWRAFSAAVTTVAETLGVKAVFTLGAMLTDVPHTRATPVRGSSADAGLADRFGLSRPRYQGPTGIVGVLQDAFAKVDIPVASLMAQVPHYVPSTPSPKAALALVHRICGVLETSIGTASLERASSRYEREVSEVVAADDDIAGYVRQLERRAEGESLDELVSGDDLAEELERFLREQGGSS
jgi:proteasome assembly chaperone (PAC2) family protein